MLGWFLQSGGKYRESNVQGEKGVKREGRRTSEAICSRRLKGIGYLLIRSVLRHSVSRINKKPGIGNHTEVDSAMLSVELFIIMVWVIAFRGAVVVVLWEMR